MKVSVITTSYNSKTTIEDTIKSVLAQHYSNLEYIIVDGGSTDGTLDVIEQYRDKIAVVVSEKDTGMYDAMNKGIRLATGEVVGILNSDDFYKSGDVISVVANTFDRQHIDCAWGDLVVVDRLDASRVVREWKSVPYKKGAFQEGWHPPHPTFFVRKAIYEQYGVFRTDLSTAADFELMLRFLEKGGITSAYIPETLVVMRSGGAGNKTYWNLIKANFACYKAFKLNGLKIDPFFVLRKPLLKFRQYQWW